MGISVCAGLWVCTRASVWKAVNTYTWWKHWERFMLSPIVFQQFCGDLVLCGSQQFSLTYMLGAETVAFLCLVLVLSQKQEWIRKQMLFLIILLLIHLSSQDIFQKFLPQILRPLWRTIAKSHLGAINDEWWKNKINFILSYFAGHYCRQMGVKSHK